MHERRGRAATGHLGGGSGRACCGTWHTQPPEGHAMFQPCARSVALRRPAPMLSKSARYCMQDGSVTKSQTAPSARASCPCTAGGAKRLCHRRATRAAAGQGHAGGKHPAAAAGCRQLAVHHPEVAAMMLSIRACRCHMTAMNRDVLSLIMQQTAVPIIMFSNRERKQ